MTPGTSPWQLVALDERHSTEVRCLFQQVFGQPMSQALWHWKYAQGRGLATGTRDRQGQLLAHYGGTARTLWVLGQPAPAVQLGDVMVAPKARGFLSRNGPFGVATQGFLQQHVGAGRAFALGFGFPGARHVRLGQKLGLYEATQEVLELSWADPPGFSWHQRLRWQLTPLDWGDAATDITLNALWDAMRKRADALVMGERDARWWRHRFANHPQTGYRCWWLRERISGRAVAALVLKPGSLATAPDELLDWVAPLTHASLVLQAACQLAAQSGQALLGWFSATVVHALAGCHALSAAQSQPACLACVTRHQDAALPALASLAWWLTGGDTDFR